MSILLLTCLMGSAMTDPPEVRTICAFDGHPEEQFMAVGPWAMERQRALVRFGTGSIRVTMSAADNAPGIHLERPLDADGWRHVVVDIYSTRPEITPIQIRLDDDQTKNEDGRYRRSVDLVRGWNRVAVDLANLEAKSKARRLDPGRLRYVSFHCWKPKSSFDLIFDHLRLERPAGAQTDKYKKQICKTFDLSYPRAPTGPARQNLVATLLDMDMPQRCRVLHKRVLARETDARVLQDTVQLLGRTTRSSSIEEAIRLAGKSDGQTRWLWLDALGRMQSSAARDYVRSLAGDASTDWDRVAAIRALIQRNDPSLIPLCAANQGGGWQIRAARVQALRNIVVGEAFPALTGYVKDPSARVRTDAQSALANICGRDLGDDPEAWMAWWKVNKTKLGGLGKTATAIRSPYGSYYGMPLYPGRLCFIIDVSGSMDAALGPKEAAYVAKAKHLQGLEVLTRLDLAREEAKRAIRELPEQARVQLIWFSTVATRWSRRGPAFMTSGNRIECLRRLDRLNANGGTDIHGALVRAFSPSDGARFKAVWAKSVDTIYLLSDGEPGYDQTITSPAHLVLDMVERNRVRMIRVNTIGMGAPDRPLLRDLATRTGGTYVDLAK